MKSSEDNKSAFCCCQKKSQPSIGSQDKDKTDEELARNDHI